MYFMNLKAQFLALIHNFLVRRGFFDVDFKERCFRSPKMEITYGKRDWLNVAFKFIRDGGGGRVYTMFHFQLLGVSVFLKHPWISRLVSWEIDPKDNDLYQAIGFRLEFPTHVVVNWKAKNRYFYSPLNYDWYRTSTALTMGPITWHHDVKTPKGVPRTPLSYHDPRWTDTFDVTYLSKGGVEQPTTITLSLREDERRRRCLMWCPWFAKVKYSVDWRSSAELGGEAGSWKGGVMGSSCEMIPGESPRDAFVRMLNLRKW